MSDSTTKYSDLSIRECRDRMHELGGARKLVILDDLYSPSTAKVYGGPDQEMVAAASAMSIKGAVQRVLRQFEKHKESGECEIAPARSYEEAGSPKRR